MRKCLPIGVSGVSAGHHGCHVHVEAVIGEKVLGGVFKDFTAHVHDQHKRGTVVGPANYTTEVQVLYDSGWPRTNLQ